MILNAGSENSGFSAVAESGFAGFDAPAWWAILAPARTPPEILRRMNEEINKALPELEEDGKFIHKC